MASIPDLPGTAVGALAATALTSFFHVELTFQHAGSVLLTEKSRTRLGRTRPAGEDLLLASSEPEGNGRIIAWLVISGRLNRNVDRILEPEFQP